MDRKAGYKECPRCGLRNKPSALQCDFCGLRFIAGEDWDDNIQALEKMGGNEEKVLVDDDISKRIEATIVKRDKINASPMRAKEPEREDYHTQEGGRTGKESADPGGHTVRTVDRGGPGNRYRGFAGAPPGAARPGAGPHRYGTGKDSHPRAPAGRVAGGAGTEAGKGEEGGKASGQTDREGVHPGQELHEEDGLLRGPGPRGLVVPGGALVRRRQPGQTRRLGPGHFNEHDGGGRRGGTAGSQDRGPRPTIAGTTPEPKPQQDVLICPKCHELVKETDRSCPGLRGRIPGRVSE